MIATLNGKVAVGMTTRCYTSGDAPCEEAVLNGVERQGIHDLIHSRARVNGVCSSNSLASPPTHPANPVLALSKYQRRHEVVMTSRIEEVTSPMVNTHYGHDVMKTISTKDTIA